MAKQYIRKKADGKFYYKDPEKTIRHRIDGPAIEWVDGDKSWLVNDKLHRIDGPAVQYTNGYTAWYVNGVFIFGINKEGNIDYKMK